MKDEEREERRWPVHFFGNGRGAWGIGGGRGGCPQSPAERRVGNNAPYQDDADDEEDVVEVLDLSDGRAIGGNRPYRLGLADGLVLALGLLLLAALAYVMTQLD